MTSARKAYNENGVYIAKSAIPQELINNYNADFRKIFSQQLDFLGEVSDGKSTLVLMQSLFQKDLKRYLSTLTLSAKLFSLYKIIASDHVSRVAAELGIVTPIWQTKPVIHCMANELKIPDGYYGVGVHQDWPTLQSSLNDITIWIPFGKVTKNNFPLEVIPGTHLLGLCSGTQTTHYFETDNHHYKIEDFIPLEVDVGDVVFMSNFTIHRTQTVGEGLRLSVSMRYEDASEPTFVKRNYPYTEHRAVKRDVLFPEFPQQQEVQNIFKN